MVKLISQESWFNGEDTVNELTFVDGGNTFVATRIGAVQYLTMYDCDDLPVAQCRYNEVGDKSSFDSGFNDILAEINNVCNFPRKFVTSEELP